MKRTTNNANFSQNAICKIDKCLAWTGMFTSRNARARIIRIVTTHHSMSCVWLSISSDGTRSKSRSSACAIVAPMSSLMLVNHQIQGTRSKGSSLRSKLMILAPMKFTQYHRDGKSIVRFHCKPNEFRNQSQIIQQFRRCLWKSQHFPEHRLSI